MPMTVVPFRTAELYKVIVRGAQQLCGLLRSPTDQGFRQVVTDGRTAGAGALWYGIVCPKGGGCIGFWKRKRAVWAWERWVLFGPAGN